MCACLRICVCVRACVCVCCGVRARVCVGVHVLVLFRILGEFACLVLSTFMQFSSSIALLLINFGLCDDYCLLITFVCA